MIKLNKNDIPVELSEKIQERTERLLGLLEAGADIPDSLKSAYSDPAVKALLRAETYDKCVYCESKISHAYFGDVEHIIPKAFDPRLTFEYTNLTIACSICNNKKRAYYSVENPLINPHIDEPEEEFIALGPLVFYRPGHTRAHITQLLLQLNRSELHERRKERLERLYDLIDIYMGTPAGDMRELLRDQLLLEAEPDKEYAFTVRSFLVQTCGLKWETKTGES